MIHGRIQADAPTPEETQTFTVSGGIYQLAFELAAEAATGIIDNSCNWCEIHDDERWLDLNSLEPGDCDRELRYCEARELLRHHPSLPHLVQIIEGKI
jgi:hypothetical protein